MTIPRLHCVEPWFSLIRSGQKPVEGRKNSPKYRDIVQGDIIEFYEGQERFQAVVKKIEHYPSIDSYLDAVTVEKALPGIHSLQDAACAYLQWSTKEEIEQSGFLALFVEPLSFYLRRFHKNDLKNVLKLFHETVHAINAKDYSKEQLKAWAPAPLDEVRWLSLLESHRTYVAVQKDELIGFGDLTDEGLIDHLYTHKDHQGEGVGGALLQLLEKEARKSGLTSLSTEASITAKGFFEKRGYALLKESERFWNGQSFRTYHLSKNLL